MTNFTPPATHRVSRIFLSIFFINLVAILSLSCESNSGEVLSTTSNSVKATSLYYTEMQKIPDIPQEELNAYLLEVSSRFIKSLDISEARKTTYLTNTSGTLISDAAKLYFEITKKGRNEIKSGPDKEMIHTTASAAAYQPKFTVINMSNCPIDYTVFIKTQMGDCNHLGTTYYTIDNLIQAPVGTTTYLNGFASFGNHTWYPTYESTQDLVNQGLTAYYYSVKYEVGTNCSNISIGPCGAAQGTSHTQQCQGCSGGSSYYTVTITSSVSTDPITGDTIYSNPESTSELDQDMLLFIVEN